METKSKFKSKSSYDRAFCLGRLIFTYIYPLFLIGLRNKGLSLNDLSRCPKRDEVESNIDKLSRNWNREKKGKNPKFWWALFRTFGPDFVISFMVLIIEELVLRIAQPICLGFVIRYFSGDDSISYELACYAGGAVCLCTALFISMHHPCMLYSMRIGMRARTSCCSLMYQKALRLSRASIGQTAVGQIVNIMSNDVNRMDEFSIFMPYFFVAPVQTAIVIYIVWGYLGWSCFFGVGLLLLFIPFQALMGKLFSRVRLNTAMLTDTRLRFMNEIISGMRVIKMYCWEIPFANRVAQARKAEIGQIRKGCTLKAINLSMFFVASRIILFVSFVAYVLFGGLLTSEAVFVSMALLNTLRLTMTFFFPMVISQGAELKITCKRIENFLMLDEFQSERALNSNFDPAKRDRSKPAQLVVNNITAKWSAEVNQPTLKDVSARLKPGDLLAVIGPVGSGKSSFLMTLLGELPVTNGDITLDGKLSYAGQDSWSFNDTVRNNILFGMDYDPKRYQKVIEVCALTRDLELMPFGDRTLVGEKGVSLSGGQKARINLARAVYRSADIFLLDDPLSAVDAAVAEHIFEKCILDHLKTKIRILVTHQIQFIQKATKILVLKDGHSLAYGSFNELQHLGIDFMSLLTSESEEILDNRQLSRQLSRQTSLDKLSLDGSMELTRSRTHSKLSVQSMASLNEALSGRTRTLSSVTQTENFQFAESLEVETVQVDTEGDAKIEEEQFQRGSISGKVYLEYIRSGSNAFSLLVMILFTLASQFIFHGSDLFLTAWTNKNQKDGSKEDQNTDIIIYSVLIGALFITTIIRSVSFFSICMKASENLHNQIFSRLLRVPVSFFDSNPAGRILNRFTKDLGIIDEMLPSTAYDLNLTVSQAIGVVVTVCIVNWYLALPAVLLAIVIYYVRKVYIISARDIKRYEGIARSPVYSHVGITINGLASIRAFGAQQSFRDQFYTYQNDHSSTWFMFIGSSRAMGLLMDWVSMVYICIITASVLLIGGIPGGSAGLAISSGLMLSGMTQWGVRQSAEFESQMTSVERIVEYQELDQEAPKESIEDLKPNKEWPAKGEIQFDNMSLVYGNNDAKPVLKNLKCRVEGGEKIGIVGRTGAGKSSMIAALFRLTEPKGVIRIDGVDIQSIGLDDLRQKISIIPQDPVIYSGTIRYNLDPFNQYSDEEIWSALDQVQLKAPVNNFAGKLDAQLSESGGNLSVGQRQLICLARAILRRNRILVLDEATANIDHQTDNLIQETIRTQFVQCTVLTIAHRLNTIIDSDRVLVLDAGEIVEFDTPYLLLQRQGAFYNMCQTTGPKMYAHLLQLAKFSYNKRRDPSTPSATIPANSINQTD